MLRDTLPKFLSTRLSLVSGLAACVAIALLVWPVAEVAAQTGSPTTARPPAAAPKAPVRREPSAEDLNRRFIEQFKAEREREPAPATPEPKPVEKAGFSGGFRAQPAKAGLAQGQTEPRPRETPPGLPPPQPTPLPPVPLPPRPPVAQTPTGGSCDRRPRRLPYCRRA